MTTLLTLACCGLVLLNVIEHRRSLRVERDLRACVRILDRAVALAQGLQQQAHLSPLLLAQAQRMQDAQDETDAYRARGGRAR